MVWFEGKSSSAAAIPPSAAEPAAGIASFPREAQFMMPAASSLEAADVSPFAVRQWAIGPEQCRWIVAYESAGADALMCGALAEPRRPFCARHCALAYMKLVPEEEAGAESEAKTEEGTREDADPEAEEAE